MIIYKTTNLINGLIYIGQSIHNNCKYLGSGKTIKLAIKKHGKENFKKEILIYCKSQEELDYYEMFYINLFNSTNNSIGYNLAIGSTNPPNRKGIAFTEEHKKKISIKLSGKNNGAFGKPIGVNQKNAVIQSNFKRKGENHPLYNKKHNQSSKDKTSASMTGKLSGGKHPLAIKITINDINFGCIKEAAEYFSLSAYKFKKKYSIN